MQFCVGIALYRLALSRDVLTDEHRKRYDDTRNHDVHALLLDEGKLRDSLAR